MRREMEIGQVFQDMGVIHGGVAIGHFDMTPAFERREHHEQIGGPIALVFVIETGRAPGFHRDRRACLGNELLRGLVQANQRAIRIVGPRVDSQHVFHRRYERAVGLGWDDPALAAMGLENVFLSARPIVESLARSTISSSTTFSSNNARSSALVPWAVANKPGRSVWLLSRRRISAEQPAPPVVSGSARPRSLPPQVACEPGKPSMGRFPGPQ